MVRLGRYLLGLIIATVLLVVILPHVGYPESRYVPPQIEYQKADGMTTGWIVNKRDVPSDDPFRIGDRLYFFDYTFNAQPIDHPEAKKTVTYQGEVRCDRDMYQHFQVGDHLDVKYLQSYPWVNGVEERRELYGVVSYGPGIGCGEGSNILSGWLIWPGVALVLAYIIMAIIDQFAPKQDY